MDLFSCECNSIKGSVRRSGTRFFSDEPNLSENELGISESQAGRDQTASNMWSCIRTCSFLFELYDFRNE